MVVLPDEPEGRLIQPSVSEQLLIINRHSKGSTEMYTVSAGEGNCGV